AQVGAGGGGQAPQPVRGAHWRAGLRAASRSNTIMSAIKTVRVRVVGLIFLLPSNTVSTAIKLESFGCRRCRSHGRQHGRTRYCERPTNPAWSKKLACAEARCTGTGRSRVWPAEGCRRSVSGRRGVVADDARTREV